VNFSLCVDVGTNYRENKIVKKLWHWDFREIMEFQQQKRGCETLDELMSLPSEGTNAKVTVILNHFQRKTLCSQLDALLEQTLSFHEVWVVAFGSPEVDSLRSIVEAYNDTRISIVESKYDYRYYGRFQLALQVHTAPSPLSLPVPRLKSFQNSWPKVCMHSCMEIALIVVGD
jgi:hypothetical protein